LQHDQGFSEDEAYRTMQRESRQRRKSMREIAEAILLADSMKRLYEPTALQANGWFDRQQITQSLKLHLTVHPPHAEEA
jgi:hypothetical protein